MNNSRSKTKSVVVLSISALLVFIVVAAFGIISLLNLGKTGDVNQIVAPDEETTTAGEVLPEESLEGDSETGNESGSDTITVGEYEIKVDKQGMAVMPVTTDPYEAAAGAAAVAFTVDFDKFSRDEYFREAIDRMTNPDAKYRGPQGEIDNAWGKDGFSGETTKSWFIDPAELLWNFQVEQSTRHEYEPVWWILSHSYIYENMQALPGNTWIGHPQEVLNHDEISAQNPNKKIFKSVDTEPSTPGAHIGSYYVRLSIEGEQGSAQPKYNVPAYFTIWCDAPEDGGLCGVAGTMMLQHKDFPATWSR